MVGKISPFFIVGKYSILGTTKTPLLWCRVCRGSCYDRARFNNLQQAVFSLFALCSMVNHRTNRKKNLGQSRLHHRFHLFPTCSRFRLFFDSFSGFARGSFVVQLPFATPKTLVCAATKWKRTGQADLSICL